jgi:hypothetical protein
MRTTVIIRSTTKHSKLLRHTMFILLLLAASAIVGMAFTVRAVITDGPQRVPTQHSQLIR